MKICRRIPGWLLLCLLILPLGGRFVLPAHAASPTIQDPPQSNAGAFVSAPNVQNFPRIQAYLKVHDAQGAFIHGLAPEQVTVLEDSAERPATRLEETRPGVQVVIAVNPGPSFAIRNAKAVSRYDLVKDALRAWANSRAGSNIDDLSLLITSGPAASHTADPLQWISSLNSEQVDARTAAPSLDTLFRAVSLASDPAPRDGMSRAVIFVTPPPEGQLDQSLENLAAQAREQHIVIYVWLVASSIFHAIRSAVDGAQPGNGRARIYLHGRRAAAQPGRIFGPAARRLPAGIPIRRLGQRAAPDGRTRTGRRGFGREPGSRLRGRYPAAPAGFRRAAHRSALAAARGRRADRYAG
jgi:hypothetical protein